MPATATAEEIARAFIEAYVTFDVQRAASYLTEDAYAENGFSWQMWEPFGARVASTHPDDVLVMYEDGGQSSTSRRSTSSAFRRPRPPTATPAATRC